MLYLFDLFSPGLTQRFKWIKGDSPLIVETSNSLYVNTAFKINSIVLILWFLIVCIIFIYHLNQYLRFKKNLISLTNKQHLDTLSNFIDQERQQLHIHRKIELRTTKEKIFPFTLGIINPVIIIPDIKDEKKIKLILAHELYHIKRFDSLIKLLALVVKIIYWFNPLAHYLYTYLDTAIEYSCDEFITQNMDSLHRKQYAHLIIDMAVQEIQYPKQLITPFSYEKEKIKERGIFIMTNNKKPSPLAIFLSAGLILVSSMPILACERTQKIACDMSSVEFFLLEDTDTFLAFQKSVTENDLITDIIYPVQFVDNHGNVYPADFPSERITCQNHTFVNGTLMKHTKKKDESCVIKHYDGKQCTKCGYSTYDRLIKTESYTICPH